MPEGRQILDERAVEGFVVAHCDDSKGWVFLLKHTDCLVASAIAHWPDDSSVSGLRKISSIAPSPTPLHPTATQLPPRQATSPPRNAPWGSYAAP
ncbi:uncharacterized protein VP01_1224g2 [Puccinia sorghi]|uniref:Uncharacterized protein n=1 Tax=Puccinia sorghi TaxID=27349 RepID=A0A0L6VRF9_9BASI|nr:uncharacterized protein VP01_1224g2 [Puccinia sorghi]